MKLSFVMQVYLGDYPGARSNPIEKFNRVVNSFIDQINPNWELIIVSDGCKITEEQYLLNFTHEPRIKFKFVEPAENRMYENNDGAVFHRGYPRQVGVEMATGDWIGYVDSDDFILNSAVNGLIGQLSIADKISEDRPEERKIKMVFNTRIIENFAYLGILKLQRERFKDDPAKLQSVATIESDIFKIPGLPSEWISVGGKTMGTVAMWHKKGFPDHKWSDVSEKGTSEDIEFANNTIKNHRSNLDHIQVHYYVRCHWSKLWDH